MLVFPLYINRMNNTNMHKNIFTCPEADPSASLTILSAGLVSSGAPPCSLSSRFSATSRPTHACVLFFLLAGRGATNNAPITLGLTSGSANKGYWSQTVYNTKGTRAHTQRELF